MILHVQVTSLRGNVFREWSEMMFNESWNFRSWDAAKVCFGPQIIIKTVNYKLQCIIYKIEISIIQDCSLVDNHLFETSVECCSHTVQHSHTLKMDYNNYY